MKFLGNEGFAIPSNLLNLLVSPRHLLPPPKTYTCKGERRRVRLLSEVALWYRRGQPPLPIRWVLVVNVDGDPEPAAFFGTCPACESRWIVTAFVLRWNVEVTFEESRRHLGVDTPRTMLQTF